MRALRVLHFYKTYWPDSFGGAERAIHAIATGTGKLGIESEVLSLSKSPKQMSQIFDGHLANKARLDLTIASTGLSVEAIRTFRASAAQADVVHYHFPWPYMDALHFLTRHGKPSLVTYHSDVVRQRRLNRLYAPLRDRFLGAVDVIVATSPNYLQSSPVLQRFAAKTQIIPIGLDPAKYLPARDEERQKWRDRLPGPFVLFIGEFRYYKGLDVLIQAARLSRHDIVMLGTGPLESHLREKAQGLGNLHFLGRMDDQAKAALLELCVGVVFPSNLRSEAFGVSLVEASMFAKPMISCEIGTGTSFINVHGETGVVVAPSDPHALAKAIETIVTNGPERHRYGQAAQHRFVRLFTSEKMSADYVGIYRRLAR